MSASTVDAHADSVQQRHAAADGRIESAQKGLPASAATALSGAVSKWQDDTATLFGRMVDHSTGLRAGAAGYQQTDESSASQIESAAAPIRPEDMGL